MKRKSIISFMLIAVLIITAFTGCGKKDAESGVDPVLMSIYDAIDVDFASEVTTKVASMGTHPELGYRLAGSKGEKDTVDYLKKTFEEIGLKDVKTYETTVDTWSMTKSDLYYTDGAGKEQKLLLGSYQTTLEADKEEYELIYLNEGTMNDYDGVDANGKIILIDIDQSENWWINWPAYQAKLKGAVAVIAANVGGYGQLSDETLVSQDVCGPADAPALSITNKDSKILQDLISKSNTNSIKIKLDIDAKVTNNGKSQNVAGIIPGQSDDEIIFLMAHLDGYFYAWHDDASGVGMATALAKAVIDSEYTPEKTIVVVSHGAEEWGVENSRYDWATGAYKQIMENTPEWADSGFSVINCESGCARDDDTHLCLGATYELNTALTKIVIPMDEESPASEGSEIYSPATVWSEDFPYSLAGIPGMVTRKTSGEFNLNSYHSNMDTKEVNFSEERYMFAHKVFANILYTFDNMAVQPLDFTTRLEALKESISAETCPKNSELVAAVDKAMKPAKDLTKKIDEMNVAYIEAKGAGDEEEAADILKEGKAFNKELKKLFKDVQNLLTALDWEDNVVFPHECSQGNIDNLQKSISALQNGNAAEAIDEYLFSIDYNWYAYEFDKETYRFFVDQTIKGSQEKLLWGTGMIKQGNEDLFDVIASLNSKYEEESPELSKEIEALKTALANQEKIGEKIVLEEIKILENIANTMTELVK